MSTYDIAVIGAGITGLTAALAIAIETPLQIAVIEAHSLQPRFKPEEYALRMSAISLASKHIFQNIGVWDLIKAKRISPYQKMEVWDESILQKIFFDAESLHENALGYIIEDNAMRDSLMERAAAFPNIHFFPSYSVAHFTKTADAISIEDQKGNILSAKLLVGADGAESIVRKRLGFTLQEEDYGQRAIVLHVRTELPHAKTARQRFLSTGPLAFLPLTDPHHSSIVWSLKNDIAEEWLSLSDEVFEEKLAQDFQYTLGKVQHISKRQCFPLHMRHVKQYVQENVALIGDAAHTIHPLAGQGVNLGLLDAAELAETVMNAYNKRRSFYSVATLRRYERSRKNDTLMMLMMVGMLKQLFTNDVFVLKKMRNQGLSVTSRLPWLKNCLASYALGRRFELPRLATNKM